MSILDEYIVAQPKSKIKAGEGNNKGKYRFSKQKNPPLTAERAG